MPQEPIDNYFPEIISSQDYYAVQAAITSRRGKGGEVGKRVNIFANILKCGECGSSAIRINKSGKQASVDKYYKWVAVACNSGRRGVTTCGHHPWKLDLLEKAILDELIELDIDSILDNKSKDQGLAILKKSIQSLSEQIATIQKQRSRLVDVLAEGDAGLGVITDRIRSLTKQEEDLLLTKKALDEEYDIESHRLSAMSRSVDEIKRLTDQLEDNDVRIKLQTEVRRLVDKIDLHFKSKKFVVYYHKPKMVIRFNSGRSVSFIESDADMIEDEIQID